MTAPPPGDARFARDPTLVTWFRQDVRRAVWRAWARAFTLVCVAMLLLGFPLGLGAPTGWRVFGWIVGGLCLLAGPIYLMAKLQRVLGAEIYLAIHQGGVRWRDGGGARTIAWEAIARAVVRDDAVVIEIEDGAPPLIIRDPLDGITREELVAMLEDLQRKALMGLRLEPSRRPRSGHR